MGFTLRIKFVCLCFFVPDKANGKLHVLMPATCAPDDTGECGVEHHNANLVYPYPGGKLDAQGHAAEPGDARVKDYTEMTGWALTLGGQEGRADPTLRTEIVDVTVNAGWVDPVLLQYVQHPRIASHVTLTAGSLKSVTPAAEWIYNQTKLPIAQEILWTMDLPGDELTWSRTRLKPAGEQPAEGDVEDLPPVPADGGAVEIEIHHTTAAGFPIPRGSHHLPPETIAKHFAAFYSLFPAPNKLELPEFLHDQGVLPRTCMGASGRLR